MTSGVPYAEVIGDPVSHSKSPLIHNFWLKKLALPYVYRATRVTAADLPTFLEQRRADPLWRGCNVTMPHKVRVLATLSEQSDEVLVIGAANTITPTGQPGRFSGHNTDWLGVREPLLHAGLGKRPPFVARLLGTGGAAFAAAYALERLPNRTTLINYGRSSESAAAFRQRLIDPDIELSAPISDLAQKRSGSGEPELLINATPLGMNGKGPLDIDLSFLAPGSTVFDMVYDPIETRLLAQARERGLQTIDGLSMLVSQAAAAFELLFGEAAPREHDQELRELLTA